MSDNRDIVLRTVVDASDAKVGLDETSRAANKMAGEVALAAIKAGKAIDGIGTGADASAQKLDKSTRSIISSIQRTTATMEAGGRGTKEYYEAIANQRGANADALKPYLAQLDAAIVKQKAASGSLDNMGMSAKQTAFALRGVPAQFTDIFTSLQAGQAPMTVLLQQGGQLKDMFGGIGGAAKAMGGYILGMINPLTIAAATVGTLGYAFYQGGEEARNMAKAIIMTGNAAGTSVNQLREITNAVSASSGATKGAVNEALNAIINTGGVAAGSLGKVAEAAIKMSKATGESIEDTVKRFSELGKEPVKASEKLNEQYNYLTASVYKQIKALEDQGRATEAAALAQSTFADAAKDMASRVEANLGGLESAWRGVAGAAKWAWDKMLNVGREGSINEQISALKKQLATGSFDFALTEGDIKSQIASLEKKLATETATTAEKTKQNELDKSGIAWIKEGDKYLSKKQQMEAEITKTRNLGVAAGASELEINKRIAAVREKFTEKASGGKSQAVKDAESLVSLLDRLHAQDDGEFASDYVKNVQLLVKGWSAGELSLEQYNAEFALLRQQQPGHKAYLKDVIDLERERAKYAADISKETKDLIEKADAAEYENSKIGATEQQLIALTAARYDEQIALKEEKIAAIEMMEGRNAEVEAIEQQISALRRLQSAEIAKPKLREQAREWEKFSDDINRALTDALMRGFESGKSFGENFVDSLKNSLKTAALKLVVNVVTSTGGSVVNAAINAVAGTGGANGGAGTNYMGLANNASSMYNMYGAASQLFTGASVGASTASLAYANGVGMIGGDSLGALYAANGGWAGVEAGGAAASAVGAEAGWASMLGEAAAGAWVLAIPAIAGAISAAGSRKAYEFDGVAIKGDYSGSNFTGSAATKWEADGGWWESGDKMKKWMPLTDNKDAIIEAFFGGGLSRNGMTGYVTPVSGEYSKAIDMADLGDLRDTPAIAGVDNSKSAAEWDAQYAAWQKANPRVWSGIGWAGSGEDWTGGDRPEEVSGYMPSLMGAGFFGSVSKTPVLSTDPVMLAALDNAIDAIFKATQTSFKALADQFDDTDLAGKINAFSTSINLDTKSGDIDKVLAALASDVNAKMAQAFLPSIETLRLPEEAWQTAFNRVMVEVAGTSRILDMMGVSIKEAFGSDTNSAITAIDGLSKAFGGIDNLSTSFSAYYANFYSQEEQRAQAMEDMGKSFDALNLAMPTTREGFRALVDSLDLATVGGQTSFKSLMDLQGVFANLVPAIDSSATSVEALAAAAKELADWKTNTLSQFAPAKTAAQAAQEVNAAGLYGSPGALMTNMDLAGFNAAIVEVVTGANDATRLLFEGQADNLTIIQDYLTGIGEAAEQAAADMAALTRSLQDEGVNLGVELLRAQGNEQGALAAERTIAIAGYTAEQIALYDTNAATRARITTLNEEAEAEKARIAERTTLQDEYDNLTMTSAELLNKQRNALDESNWGLFDNIQAIKTAKTAMADLAQQIEAIGNVRTNIGDARQNVVSQMADFDGPSYYAAQKAILQAQMTSAPDTTSKLGYATKLQTAITNGLQAQINALDKTRDVRLKALQDEANIAEENASKAKQAADNMASALGNIADYANGLKVGNLSTLSPEAKLQAAGSEYQRLLGLAKGGDATAAGNLTGASDSYLGLAKDYYASTAAYSSIFASVEQSLGALGSQKSVYEQIAESAKSTFDLAAQTAASDATYQADLIALQQSAISQFTALDASLGAYQASVEPRLDTQVIELQRLNVSSDVIGDKITESQTAVTASLNRVQATNQQQAAILAQVVALLQQANLIAAQTAAATKTTASAGALAGAA
jgi:phage-related minor tail protein